MGEWAQRSIEMEPAVALELAEKLAQIYGHAYAKQKPHRRQNINILLIEMNIFKNFSLNTINI